MANNPASHTGVNAMDQNLFDLYGDEIERNKTGYRLGIDWIKNNPMEFLELSAKRFARFSGKSSVYFNPRILEKCKCGGNYYAILSAADKIWWFILWTLAAYSVTKNFKIFNRDLWSMFILVVVSSLFLVHSIFIAEGRYHDPLAGLLVMVAITAFSRKFSCGSRLHNAT